MTTATFLFISVQMPLILLLTITAVLGFVLGVLATYFGKIKPGPDSK